MFAILKKEFNSFFASPIGYLVIGVFLVLTGLFLWVFKGDFNILDYGFADLSVFFALTPLILLFLVPAVTMRSFSEEKKQGTLELLLTKPISTFQIVLGKYGGARLLVILALSPTLLYVYTLWQLGKPVGNLDVGSTIGAYLGLVLVASAMTAIGIFSSALTNNQIVAFIMAVFLCFLFYLGFEGIAGLMGNANFIEDLGMKAHHESISRGVVDIRDAIYFIVLTLLFLTGTWILLQRNAFKKGLAVIISLLTISLLIGRFNIRFDLTSDKRYTLSEAATNALENADETVTVDVLLDGDIPSEFKKLQVETRQILEEFSAETGKLNFNFIDPLEDSENTNQVITELQQMGLKPAQATITENTSVSQKVFFPWAIANLREKSVRIPLLKNTLGATQEERVTNSIQNLEYAFADGFTKLTTAQKKKVAVLRSHGAPDDRYIADFLTTLQEYYRIAPFDLKAFGDDHQKSNENLNRFDLLIVPKPTEAFTEEEKQVLDRFVMNGGKSLWLIDAVAMEMDSLFNAKNRGLAIPRDLNLNDMFFRYGIRVNPVLVKDLYHAPIVLATGSGNEAQYNPVPWLYDPLAVQEKEHPITKNTGAVRFQFANAIDTLASSTEKTILLESSQLSKTVGMPREVSLKEISQQPDQSSFNKPNIPLAVLLEGIFTSTYKNRVKPLPSLKAKDESKPTKMIVIADGDLIKNQLDSHGNPLELGFDKWTNNFYENKQFLLNSVNYLLDDTGLMNIRAKKINVAFLDNQKVAEERIFWQAFNIGLPLAILAAFGIVFNYFRKHRYAR